MLCFLSTSFFFFFSTVIEATNCIFFLEKVKIPLNAVRCLKKIQVILRFTMRSENFACLIWLAATVGQN